MLMRLCVCVLGVCLWPLCVSNGPSGVDPTTHFPSGLWSSAALQARISEKKIGYCYIFHHRIKESAHK